MSEFWIAGVDEAGRGPLAGPVVAAAVILDPNQPVDGLADSKQLSPGRREELSFRIREKARSFSIVEISAAEIDRLNILAATLRAMAQAVAGLRARPILVRVDGNRAPDLGGIPVETVIGGDRLHPAISAAGILAKVYRDERMRELDGQFPDYGFARHKGYATAAHLVALARLGPCLEHRRSFRPVSQLRLPGL